MTEFLVEHWTGPPTQEDLNSINKMNREELKQTTELTWDQFISFLNKPHIIFIVARKKDTKEMIGKQTMYLNPLDCGIMKTYLDQVTTDSRYTRMGVAKAIWNKLIEVTREKGGAFEAHWTSGNKKEAAQQFYDAIPGCTRRDTNNFVFKMS
ncbi:MAG: GNAT family N-acetyltransferase [bacterium]|nr:GNAT family N-acetyltransferase [bacterium]